MGSVGKGEELKPNSGSVVRQATVSCLANAWLEGCSIEIDSFTLFGSLLRHLAVEH